MNLLLRSTAEQEIAEAAVRYDAETTGLGSRFLDEIDRTLKRIADFPLMYQLVRTNTRRAYLKHFPFVLFYTVDNDKVIVVGCHHMRRNPSSWPEA